MTVGQCPSCGAEVSFSIGQARIRICEFCRTVVARKGDSLSAVGQVAALVDTDSTLSLGLRGRHAETDFKIAGRLQKDHGSGVWDEWYLAFDDGRQGWLSQSEGEWNLSFFVETVKRKAGEWKPKATLELSGRQFVVEEVGQAQLVSAEGQLPKGFLDSTRPAAYVDATDEKGRLLTLDYSDSPLEAEGFVGLKVELSQLGFDPQALKPRHQIESLRQARCTQCNGPLELKAPDLTQRVACPFCGALLDVTQGRLSFLKALETSKNEPRIPLGRKGKLFDTEWICIAFLLRSCRVEGYEYGWEEYLLYHPQAGFRWLLNSNGHWTFLSPIAAGIAQARRREFKLFQRVTATTNYVLGECYWKVQVGEQAQATEFIAPPRSLNEDLTDSEVTYTLGEYLPHKTIKQAFNLKSLPSPYGIAPSQPNPNKRAAAQGMKWAGFWGLLILACFLAFNLGMARKRVMALRLDAPAKKELGSPDTLLFSEPFQVPTTGNVEVRMQADMVNNDWVSVQVDLVNEGTGEVRSLYKELSYYSGVEGGESWSEGSASTNEYISRVPQGTYVARVSAVSGEAAHSVWVGMTSDVPRFLWVVWAWVLLAALPLLRALRVSSFETRRWDDSYVEGEKT